MSRLTIILSSLAAAPPPGETAFLRSAASLALSWPDLGLEVDTPLLWDCGLFSGFPFRPSVFAVVASARYLTGEMQGQVIDDR